MEYDKTLQGKENIITIVFDSNILYVNYDGRGDFTKFYFNYTFTNLINYIESMDLYEYVKILIPKVVWYEMKQQKMEAYNKKRKELLEKIEKIKMPDIKFTVEEIDYESFIEEEIKKYKEELVKGVVNVEILNLPSERKFTSIVERAFHKRPPFEGKENKSDKGFKDVLLWESILEYKENTKGEEEIVLYCKDNLFNKELEEEYTLVFPDEKINILKEEHAIKEILNNFAKKVLVSPHIKENEEEIKEKEQIGKYLKCKEFKLRMMDELIDANIFNDLLVIEDINNIEIKTIEPIEDENNNVSYSVKLSFILSLNKTGEDIADIIEKKKEIYITIFIKESQISNILFNYETIKSVEEL